MRTQLHSVKRLTPRTEGSGVISRPGFGLISRLKLDPYLDKILYVRVINSSCIGLLRVLPLRPIM